MSRFLTLIILLIITFTSVNAQITSNAFYTEPTEYGGGVVNDPIFFYEDMAGSELTAPAGSAYQWYQYSTVLNAFELIAGETGSIINGISEGGYQVEVTASDGNKANYYCWNFVPQMQIDSVGVPFADCSNLRVTAYTKNKSLTYYRHKSDHSELMVDYGFNWISTPAGPVSDENEYSRFIKAPTEDTNYSVEVGSKFSDGITPVNADYSYSAIAVEAKFTFETEGTAENEATEGSAPMVVRFTDESLGKITDWEWTFGDAGKDFVSDPIFTFQKFTDGGYPVVLYVRNSESECESETDPEVFTVNEMVVRAPNAFTPFSSPTQNDEFRVLYRSVNKFTMVIYNRWGRKVYSSSNPDEGWNGKIGSQKAEPGVYFYKIKAEGYNKGETLELEGAVHLIVTNN
ncbi:gliding motility-associated C-terminal domain-containing protein [Carboxylicivirga sp. A043]|uniref:T9SS type B sorting domain-containing protein n=1 Tax=Carboxylicivirga litoralis TaxID=2816963 RepID=UPI0021CB8740|nr:gliding motility-associated C-terminal domain-containing protein [Carboxylicivirga sp. A043]MCU4155350.1 gliding motility-associated C-terminal domain-containing protein [Carboxylicivirga sp. A043]